MRRSRALTVFLACAILAAWGTGVVRAQTWTGNSSNNWEDSNNWNPAGVPGGGDTAIFNNGGNGNTSINLVSNSSINRLYFNPGAAAYTIGSWGQTLTLGTEYQGNSEIILDAGLANNQTILANLLYKESSSPVSGITITNYSSADLDIAGDTLLFNRDPYPSSNLSSFLYVSSAGTGTTTISSSIQEATVVTNPELSVYVNWNSSGTVQLLGQNNFNGALTLYAGTLVINSIGNAGQASSVGKTGFALGQSGDATLRYIGGNASSNMNWSTGDGANSPAVTFDIVSSTVVMNGKWTRGYELTKTGAGTLVLNGENENTGPVTLSEGILNVGVLANGGHASGLGKSSSAASNLVFDGGTLQYSNSLSATTDRGFSITPGETAHFDIVGNSGITISGNVAPTTGGILLTGGGSLLLSGNNQYFGPTTVRGMNTTLIAGSNSGPFGGPLGINSDVILSLGATLATASNVTNLIIGSLTGDASTQLSLFAGSSQDNLTINSSRDATFDGIISWSSGGLVKQGSGTQTLTGANYYMGETIVMGGSLVISGANGTIAPTSSIGISGGASLIVENPGNATVSNRLGAGVPVTMGGGTLAFRTDATTPDVTNTLGALVLNAGTNIIENGPAAAGKNSTLTFASLTRQGSATVNFVGEGLGLSDRNRIFFTTAPTLGDWAIYNGVGYATYNATLGVVETLYADVTRGSSGQKTIYNAPDEIIRIIDGTGAASAIELGGGGDHPPSPPPPEPPTTLTNIHSIAQTATGGPVLINVASNQIFQTMSILGGTSTKRVGGIGPV